MSLAVYTAITYLFKEELFELFLALGVSVTLLLQLPGEFCLSLLVLVLKRKGIYWVFLEKLGCYIEFKASELKRKGWRLGVFWNFRLLNGL